MPNTPPTPPQKMTVKLSDRTQFTHKYWHLIFELASPHRFEFQAGQYMSFQVAPDGTRRSYSICSAPDNTHGFEIFLDVAPMGVGTKYLQGLKFGDEAQILGPMGGFTVSSEVDQSQAPLVFVATGSGVGPIRGMIIDQLRVKKSQRPMTLYWGLHAVEDLCLEEEFEELAEAFPNFHFHPVISQAQSEWPLCRGHVTDCLFVHDLPVGAHYYLCGSKGMIEDTMKTLSDKGIVVENIHHEKFY